MNDELSRLLQGTGPPDPRVMARFLGEAEVEPEPEPAGGPTPQEVLQVAADYPMATVVEAMRAVGTRRLLIQGDGWSVSVTLTN